MRKTIYLIRHGQTDYNKMHIVQGRGVDSSLNSYGQLQARAFYEIYHAVGFEVVLTSKLKRTHETIQPFIETGISWEQFEDIDEMDWGIHEGKSRTPEMVVVYKNMMDQWAQGNFDAKLENGESANELAQRILKFIAHLVERPEQKILICSHGRAMRCMITQMKGEPLGDMEKYKNENTGLYKVIFDQQGFLFETENNTQHLLNL